NKRQMPWVNSSLTVDFQFNPQLPDARKEDLSQQELKRLRDLLNRRDQQKSELEAQVKAMQRERPEKPRTKQAAKPAAETAGAPKSEAGTRTVAERCVWCFPPSTE